MPIPNTSNVTENQKPEMGPPLDYEMRQHLKHYIDALHEVGATKACLWVNEARWVREPNEDPNGGHYVVDCYEYAFVLTGPGNPRSPNWGPTKIEVVLYHPGS